MYRDLLDALRCPRGHAEAWLVAMVHRVDGTRLLEAEISCPGCGALFHVRDGIGDFREDGSRSPVAPAISAGSASSPAVAGRGSPAADSADPPDPTRLAAMLGVIGGHNPVLLAGRYASVADRYAALVGAPVVAMISDSDLADRPADPLANHPVNPDGHASINDQVLRRLSLAPGVSVMRIGARLPLGVGTLAAAAIDNGQSAPLLLGSIARAIVVRGRLVAPVSLELPVEAQRTVREIARDEQEWVAEVTIATRGLATLRMRPPAV